MEYREKVTERTRPLSPEYFTFRILEPRLDVLICLIQRYLDRQLRFLQNYYNQSHYYQVRDSSESFERPKKQERKSLPRKCSQQQGATDALHFFRLKASPMAAQ